MPPIGSENELPQELVESAALELRKRILLEQDINGDNYEETDVQKIKENDWYCQRFVLHHKGDVNDALEMVKEALKWRKSFAVAGIKESSLPLEYFKAGQVFPYNRDKLGNPILMLAVRLHHKDAEMMEEHRRFLVYWIEKFEKEDSRKKITVIFDCSSAGYSNLDLDMVKFIVNTFKNYYPWLLEAILIFDMPWLFNAAWKIIKSWLSQDAVEKIKFVNKKSILEYVDAENLPLSMGGKDTHQYVYEPDDVLKCHKAEDGVATPKV